MSNGQVVKSMDVTFGNGLHGTIAGEPRHGVVLISHGAGGDKDTALLRQTAERLSELGFLTMRWNFGYVAARRAPSAGGKREIPEMTSAMEFLSQKAPDVPVILLGKSFGARVSTYLGEKRDDIAAYIFFGLPLHAMAKNAKPRDWSHLARLGGKILFITGDKDKLCSLDHLADVQKYIRVPFKSQIVPGDHSFKPKGEELAMAACLDWMEESFAGAIK